MCRLFRFIAAVWIAAGLSMPSGTSAQTKSNGSPVANMSVPPAANFDTLGVCRRLREDLPGPLAQGQTHILVIDRTDPISSDQQQILEDALRRIEGRLELGDSLFVHQITDNHVRYRLPLMAECVPGCEERTGLAALLTSRCDELRETRMRSRVIDRLWQTVGTIVRNTGGLPFTHVIGTLTAIANDYADRQNKTFYIYSDMVEYRPNSDRSAPSVSFFRMSDKALARHQLREIDFIPNLRGTSVFVFGFGARQSGISASDDEYPALRTFWTWWFNQAGVRSPDIRTNATGF